MDKISVIIPCYNQAQYLVEAVECLVKQTYRGWEAIIVNDGSTDDTEEVALSLCQKDDRVRYVKKENGGLSSARNAGLEVAKERFIQFLDADDLIAKEKFKNAIDQFDSENVDIVISNFNLLENDELLPAFCDLTQTEFNYESLLIDWDENYTIPIHCGIFKAHLFHSFRFNTTLRAKEDWLMWLHVFENNPSYVFIDKVEAMYRQHGNNMSKDYEFMYRNISKAFEHVFFDNQDPQHQKELLKRINRYWMREVMTFKNKYEDVRNSKRLQLVNKIMDMVRF